MQFNGVIEIYPRPTPVAMVTKIWDYRTMKFSIVYFKRIGQTRCSTEHSLSC